jgi:hypothetical protein
MEKSNVFYVDRKQGAFPSYAFDLDFTRKPERRKIPPPAVLHISKKRKDRRFHRRYTAVKGAFALLRSKSSIISDISKMNMGDIAFAVMRSSPAKIGQIINISMGGLVFQYAQEAQGSAKPSHLDILLADDRFYLDGLKFKRVTDVSFPGEYEFDSVKTRLISVKFKNLTAQQKKQLNRFLSDFTSDIS